MCKYNMMMTVPRFFAPTGVVEKVSALSLLLCAGGAAAAQEARPNILCLVCEDTGLSYFGCFGGDLDVTPAIGALAREGVSYTHFYTVHGVSAPSRHALITGLYPTATGANNMRTRGASEYFPQWVRPYDVVLPEGVKCYTEFLRAQGYYCTNNVKTDYQFASPLTAWDECGKNAHWKHAPERMPFFSIFNFTVSHESMVWRNAKEPLTVDPAEVPVPPYLPDTEIVRRDIARVYSNLRIVNQLVEEKMQELREAGKLDNTIVVFYSDNGGPLLRQKRTVYEAGLHVPLIIRYPDGKGAGTTDERLCSFVDIPATMMSLLGLMPPSYMHGKAFAGAYQAPERRYIYGAADRCDEFVDKIGTVRDKRYQYVRNYMPQIPGYMDAAFRRQMPLMREVLKERDAGRLNPVQMAYFSAPRPQEEFYDVQNDPHNLHNLIHDPAYRVEIDRLREAYEQWLHQYNALWFWDEVAISEYMQPGGVQPVAEKPIVVNENGHVSLFSSTPGASIAYRINGAGLWAKHWLLYTRPVQLQAGDRLEAVATRAGYKQSQVAVYRFECNEQTNQSLKTNL